MNKACGECYKDCCSWVFSDLTKAEFAQLAKLMKPLEIEPGEIVFQEGAPPAGLYIICSGKVKLVKHSPDKAKKQLLKLLGSGELLGEEALFAGEPYIAHARTLEKTTLRLIEKHDLLNFIGQCPAVALRLIEKLAQELEAFQSKLVETAYLSSEESLARLLSLMADKYGLKENGGLLLDVELSRSELAEMAGICPETAIRILSKFKDEQLIELDKHRIIVLDSKKLRTLAEPFPITPKESLL